MLKEEIQIILIIKGIRNSNSLQHKLIIAYEKEIISLNEKNGDISKFLMKRINLFYLELSDQSTWLYLEVSLCDV